MTRRSMWLLYLLAGGDPASRREIWLDPIRVMKGLFLAQMERAEAAPREPVANPPFEFVPYSYGPFAPEVYAELEGLRTKGLVRSDQPVGKSYQLWALTEAGWGGAATAAVELLPDEKARLRRAFDIVATKNFNELLKYVYDRYPDSAERSVHRTTR